ncbi:MAG: rRNA maturation RNase YbeY [Crocinitomicaceae bacterium]
MVEIHFEETEVLDVSPEFFVSWLSILVSKEERVLGDINLIFCSDDYLLEMNREHLNHDYYTDIITFDYTNEEVISGDLFISVDRVKENANNGNEMFHVELNRVVGHGVLHLMGYNDKTEDQQKEMTLKENWALSLIVSRET